MLDYIFVAVFFIIGTLIKLVVIPTHIFLDDPMDNRLITNSKILESSYNRSLYIAYLYLSWILTFVFLSLMTGLQSSIGFLLLDLLLWIIDIGVFLYYYNPNGSSLGPAMGFFSITRNIVDFVIHFIVIIVFWSSLNFFDALIWGLWIHRVVDAFPKFYIFNTQNYENYLKIDSDLTGDEDIIISSAYFNLTSEIVTWLICLLLGFFGPNIIGNILTVLYVLYIAGFSVYRYMTIDTRLGVNDDDDIFASPFPCTTSHGGGCCKPPHPCNPCDPCNSCNPYPCTTVCADKCCVHPVPDCHNNHNNCKKDNGYVCGECHRCDGEDIDGTIEFNNL